MVPDFGRQVAEFQVHVAVIAGNSALGSSVTQGIGSVFQEKAKSGGKPKGATELPYPTSRAIAWTRVFKSPSA
jgi:hypothetical protein